jgi:hypothetical protein
MTSGAKISPDVTSWADAGHARRDIPSVLPRTSPEGASFVDSVTSGYPAGDLRVSDADRDRAISELSGHFQDGRLTIEEFEERSGRAVAARTAKELAVLFADLPQDQEAVTSPLTPGPPPGGAPAVRIGLAAPVLVGVLIGLALAFSHDGIRHHVGFAAGPGPNFAPLVGILLVIFVVGCLARRRRDRW